MKGVMMFFTVIATLAASSFGAIQWTASHPERTRRLGLELVDSHTDRSDPGCIVGGFDAENPLMVYVGGPCSELTVSGSEVTPSANFRWVEMMTVHSDIVSDAGIAPLVHIEGEDFMHASENTEYAEVGVVGHQYLNVEGSKHAGLFASTTSYVSKASFSLTHNDFVTDKDGSNITLCVVPCCADPGTDGCACSGCPTQGIQVSPGSFKYSLLAAAFDIAEDSYVGGAEGNGWAKVVASFGVGDPKTLQGELHVYQVIDFTNMKADTLTIIPPTGASQNYTGMTACTNPEQAATCPTYPVKSMMIGADGWSGEYSFPLTYNLGSWAVGAGGSKVIGIAEHTQKVRIECLKPSADLMVQEGIAKDATAAAAMKLVFLDYIFDITGVEANATWGKFMVYDPTISTASDASNDPSNNPNTPGTNTAENTTTSLAASAPLPWRICALVVALFVAAGV